EKPPPDKVWGAVSERQAEQSSASATLQMGEACDSVGAAGCVSGVCFRMKPEGVGARRCSKPCTVDADCGKAQWRCRQILPTAGMMYCVAPDPYAVDAGVTAIGG